MRFRCGLQAFLIYFLHIQRYLYNASADSTFKTNDSGMDEQFKKIKLRAPDKTKFAGWNLHGKLSQPVQQEALKHDMEEMNIDVAVLTETKWDDDIDMRLGGSRIINFKSHSDNAHARYGMGIYMNAKWASCYVKSMRISDRIAVFYFRIHNNTQGHLVIIGVYGPTTQFAKDHNEALDVFYTQLDETIEIHKRKAAMLMVIGDFNSKIGQIRRDGDEQIMGRYSIGHRNSNGERLAEFLHEKKLFLANTAYKHRRHHTATWHGEYLNKEDGKKYGIHNQIDYIAIQTRHKTMLVNARSCSGKRYVSDHSLVVVTFYLQALYPISRRPLVKIEPQWDLQQLYLREDVREEFERTVNEKIQAAAVAAVTAAAAFAISDVAAAETESMVLAPVLERSPMERYESLKIALAEAVIEKVPLAPKKLNGKIVYSDDVRMEDLSKQNATLWQRIRSAKAGSLRQAHLRELRKQVQKQLRQRIRQLNTERIEQIAGELEKNRGNRQMYEYARIMQKRVYKPLNLTDDEGFMESDAPKLIPMVSNFYEKFFNQPDKNATEQWSGIARPLDQKISKEEIRKAIARLRNHRAVGPDKRTAEEFKYGGEPVVAELEGIFNTMFETHAVLPELTEGYLLAMSKPDKPRVVENTRPLTLLNTVRKVLSTVLLNRARDKITAYISISQLGYLTGRSTTEAVWTLQWIRASVERYKERCWLLGLDLSKAFDCLDREELLRIFEVEVGATQDEMRILRVLLANTSLRARIGKEVGESFATSIGTPQGDALSPLLFLVYLEYIMRKFDVLYPRILQPGDLRIQYADDTHAAFYDRTPPENLPPIGPCNRPCDFNCHRCRADYVTDFLPAVMAEQNMTMNASKTERHLLDRENRKMQDFKQLGTNVNQDIEVNIRIKKACGAMRAYHKIWLKGNPISDKTKIRLFNSTVLPHIVQNLHAVPLKGIQAEALDVLHRKLFRRVVCVFWPNHLGNTELYKMGCCIPISVEIICYRWRFLGHLLRLIAEAPARRAMELYYTESFPDEQPRTKYLGKRPTSLPGLIKEEFELLKDRRFELTAVENLRGIKEVTKLEHLERLSKIAADRVRWRKLVEAVRDGALSRWRRHEWTRQRIRDGFLPVGTKADSEDEGDVAEQMTPV